MRIGCLQIGALMIAVACLGFATGCAVSPDSTVQQSTADDQAANSASSTSERHDNGDGDDDCDDNAKVCAPAKVLMCHVKGHCPHAILVSPNKIPSHLSHGDFLGPC